MDRCYDDIWMKEEDQSASRPLINNNFFHMDVQERSHHEMNMVSKKTTSNAKMTSNPKQQNKRKEWSFNFLAFKVFSQCICVLHLHCVLEHE